MPAALARTRSCPPRKSKTRLQPNVSEDTNHSHQTTPESPVPSYASTASVSSYEEPTSNINHRKGNKKLVTATAAGVGRKCRKKNQNNVSKKTSIQKISKKKGSHKVPIQKKSKKDLSDKNIIGKNKVKSKEKRNGKKKVKEPKSPSSTEPSSDDYDRETLSVPESDTPTQKIVQNSDDENLRGVSDWRVEGAFDW